MSDETREKTEPVYDAANVIFLTIVISGTVSVVAQEA
jgi:hypothetical protein